MDDGKIEFEIVKAETKIGIFVARRYGRDDILACGASPKAAAAELIENALACASKHLKPAEIAAIIRTQKIKTEGNKTRS